MPVNYGSTLNVSRMAPDTWLCKDCRVCPLSLNRETVQGQHYYTKERKSDLHNRSMCCLSLPFLPTNKFNCHGNEAGTESDMGMGLVPEVAWEWAGVYQEQCRCLYSPVWYKAIMWRLVAMFQDVTLGRGGATI